MNEGQKLTLQMSIFFLISFVLLGTLVIKEKQNILFLPKIETSITNYISEKYKNLDINKSKVTEENNVFTMKVTNKNNKNHYFYISYSKKEISDTYKTDYLEGKTILTHLSNKLEKDEWFNKTKEFAVENGYAASPKDYKKDPDNYKGHVGDICEAIRVMITGRLKSPDLFSIMKVLGKDRIRERIVKERKIYGHFFNFYSFCSPFISND